MHTQREEVYKARLVVQRHPGAGKIWQIHNCWTLQKKVTPVFVGIAAKLRFELGSQDVAQAYLKRAERYHMLTAQYPPKLHSRSWEVLKLMEFLYKIGDARGSFCITVVQHIPFNSSMIRTAWDVLLICKFVDRALSELIGIYIHGRTWNWKMNVL